MAKGTIENHATQGTSFMAHASRTVHTSSHLRMLLMTSVYGFRVVETGLIPRATIFGGMRYTRVWDLVPSKQPRAEAPPRPQ